MVTTYICQLLSNGQLSTKVSIPQALDLLLGFLVLINGRSLQHLFHLKYKNSAHLTTQQKEHLPPLSPQKKPNSLPQHPRLILGCPVPDSSRSPRSTHNTLRCKTTAWRKTCHTREKLKTPKRYLDTLFLTEADLCDTWASSGSEASMRV